MAPYYLKKAAPAIDKKHTPCKHRSHLLQHISAFLYFSEEKDIPRILELLKQVLQIHADIRPDIFIPGTTKYTIDELAELLKNKEKPIYVAVDENDVCRGYAFCLMQVL